MSLIIQIYLSIMQAEAEAIDRVLTDNPHIIRTFQLIMMPQNSVSVIQGQTLEQIESVHDGGIPETRRIVQRALFRAGHPKKIAFAHGDVPVVLTTGPDDELEGRGEILYMPAEMEAKMWSRIAAMNDEHGLSVGVAQGGQRGEPGAANRDNLP